MCIPVEPINFVHRAVVGMRFSHYIVWPLLLATQKALARPLALIEPGTVTTFEPSTDCTVAGRGGGASLLTKSVRFLSCENSCVIFMCAQYYEKKRPDTNTCCIQLMYKDIKSFCNMMAKRLLHRG